MRRSHSIAALALLAGSFFAASMAVSQPTNQPNTPPTPQNAGEQGERGARQPGGQEGRGPRGERMGQSVEGAMKGMNRAMEQLAKQVGNASKKEENLKLVNDIQRGAVAAKGQPVPHEVTDKAKNEAEKTKLGAQYRADLIKLMRKLLDLEESIAGDKTADATKQLAEIEKLRDESHDQMGLKEE